MARLAKASADRLHSWGDVDWYAKADRLLARREASPSWGAESRPAVRWVERLWRPTAPWPPSRDT